jgi:serine phosphatase RsbU (regulator of sigma subunit)
MSTDLQAAAGRMFDAFFRRTHLCRPSDLVDVVVEEVESALNASEVVLYLNNHEQSALVPVPGRRPVTAPQRPVEGSIAGRAFISTTIRTAPTDDPGRRRMWMPIIDGTDRMGVLELVLDASDAGEVSTELAEIVERYAHAVAQAVLSKRQYGDVFEFVQRSQPMTVGAELLWSVLPPLTYATDGLAVSAMLEPVYSNGGDAFDYAVNDDIAHFGVFDGMGHGLEAAGLSTFAVAAYRHSRRSRLSLVETCTAMDAAVGSRFEGDGFVTAVLAQLDLASGRMTWVSAGHPPPMLIRHNRVVKTLDVEPATPLGVPFRTGEVVAAEEHLEPGDSVLFYTDGLTEARLPDGRFLTLTGLAEFAQRESSAEQATPETLRRLRRAVLAHHAGVLNDDATALLVDWRRGTERRLIPQTV